MRRTTRSTISVRWVTTMSPKAFRLVDELGKTSVKRSEVPYKKSVCPQPDPIIKAEAALSEPLPQEGMYVIDITPLDGGEWVSVTLAEGKERHRVRLLTEQYAELQPLVGRISDDDVQALMAAGALCDAIRKGMELLGYGSMSRRRLLQKLIARRILRETAEAAVAYLDARGCLPEADDAIRFAEQGVRKLWGPRRIQEDLYARGFPSEAVNMAMETLEEVDFSANCARVIAKKYGEPSKDRVEIKKMTAALMRLGYTMEQIREAMK